MARYRTNVTGESGLFRRLRKVQACTRAEAVPQRIVGNGPVVEPRRHHHNVRFFGCRRPFHLARPIALSGCNPTTLLTLLNSNWATVADTATWTNALNNGQVLTGSDLGSSATAGLELVPQA